MRASPLQLAAGARAGPAADPHPDAHCGEVCAADVRRRGPRAVPAGGQRAAAKLPAQRDLLLPAAAQDDEDDCEPDQVCAHALARLLTRGRSHIAAGVQKEYTIFFVPYKTVLCERALEVVSAPMPRQYSHAFLKAEGVVAEFSHIGECHLFLVPLDADLLSMDLPMAFREYQLLGDHTCIYHAANAIMQLQTIYGVIPRIVGKGDMARVGTRICGGCRSRMHRCWPTISCGCGASRAPRL